MAQRPHPGQKEEQVAVGGLVHPLFRPEAPQPKIEETTKSQESENKAFKITSCGCSEHFQIWFLMRPKSSADPATSKRDFNMFRKVLNCFQTSLINT